MSKLQGRYLSLRDNQGFSLVELLVAMTLLIMVTLIGTYGYNLYSQYWRKELGHYQETFANIKGVTQLHTVIKNIKPYIFKGGAKGVYYYFEGGQKVLRSIVTHSISDNAFPAAFELESIELNGVNQLVYREHAMSSGPMVREADIGNYVFETVLLEGYTDLTFEYYGWPSYQTRAINLFGEERANAEPRQWYGLYSGKDTLIPPDIIRLNYIDDAGRLTLMELPVAQISEERLEFYLSDE